MADCVRNNDSNSQNLNFEALNGATGHTTPAGLSDRTHAILNELDSKLSALIDTGQATSIDLHRSPMIQQECEYLKRWLGRGEVHAELDLFGTTTVYETAISGVWWITHYNRDGKILGEYLDVTTCPELLATALAELQAGQRLLHNRLSSLSDERKQDRGVIDRMQALGFFSGACVTDNPS